MADPHFPKEFPSRVHGLGAPKRYFPVKNVYRIGAMIFSLMLLAAALLVFLYGLFVAFLAYQMHGPAMLDDKLIVPVLVAFALLVPGLAAGWMAYRNWHKGVAVYEGGIAIRDRNGIQSWRWEEIVSLTAAVTRHHFIGIETGTTHVYKLYNRQNQRFLFRDIYTNVEELAKAIQDGIFPSVYERAARQYAAGQKIIFGRVAISQSGIQIGKKTFPWSEVQQVSIQRGILKVAKRGSSWLGRANASAPAIPNLNVLLNIINQVVGIKLG
jgi:hypothetical protein